MNPEEVIDFIKKSRENIARLLREDKNRYYYAYKLADRFNQWNKNRESEELLKEVVETIEEYKFAPRLGTMQVYINAKKYWREENRGYYTPKKENA